MTFRWETFPSEGEIYAISLFYKEMRDVIVNQVRIFSDNRYVSPTNSENGTVYGVELEAKKNLGSLSSSLDNLFLNTNFTYTNAQIDFPTGMRQEMLDDRISEEFIPATRRLTGQPEYLLIWVFHTSALTWGGILISTTDTSHQNLSPFLQDEHLMSLRVSVITLISNYI